MGAINYIDIGKPSISNFGAATVLTNIISQATGAANISVVDDSFMSVATIALGIAPDALLNAISQVISRTIFLSVHITESLQDFSWIT